MQIKNTKINGFTLIELLIVIAIIGILISVAVFGSQNAFKSARDTQRRSDIKQFQNGLESYANKNNGLFYSSAGSTVNGTTTLCTAAVLGITNCPSDPDPSQIYNYQSDGTVSGGATATKYVLWATLENPTGYFVTCSNGKSGNISGSSISVSGGACPL